MLTPAQQEAQTSAGRHELHWQPGGGPPDEVWLITLLGNRSASYCSYHSDLGYVSPGRGTKAAQTLAAARAEWTAHASADDMERML